MRFISLEIQVNENSTGLIDGLALDRRHTILLTME